MKLIYQNPAHAWTEALPIGNGRLGAMVTGMCNSANIYMDLVPYIDSVWFGESFDYNEMPDYWMIEISGIPFGLMGEMLQGGGNPWRGMVYGMTNRLGWHGGDLWRSKSPERIWRLWDEFGIEDAEIIGYWDEDRVVDTVTRMSKQQFSEIMAVCL